MNSDAALLFDEPTGQSHRFESSFYDPISSDQGRKAWKLCATIGFNPIGTIHFSSTDGPTELLLSSLNTSDAMGAMPTMSVTAEIRYVMTHSGLLGSPKTNSFHFTINYTWSVNTHSLFAVLCGTVWASLILYMDRLSICSTSLTLRAILLCPEDINWYSFSGLAVNFVERIDNSVNKIGPNVKLFTL